MERRDPIRVWQDGAKGRFVRMEALNRSPDVLLSAVASLQAKYIREGANIWRHLSKMVAQYSNLKATSTYQGAENDVLFEAKYNHPAGDATCYGPQTTRARGKYEDDSKALRDTN